ncbi:sulfurtransferase [Weeksellaceae bacterium KMM 9724]|uniref:sulfurtransferase n=1 Tax=Profundicola chukchiensis TaxID=2961959 RepID=UPI0024407EA3|nr:sulfurtransferase [Profundicola chukchiensis]MDG4951027.1 sulfurtransferase [Profundicola chukchiensis]
MSDLSPIINADELLKIKDSKDLIIIDASNRDDYEKEHLSNAQFVDLNTQLSDIKDDASKGGRHPLPKIEKFVQLVSELGIQPESHVVVYDRSSAANAAARFWWMLKAFGHKKVQVLNGGFKMAKEIGYPTDDKAVQLEKSKVQEVSDWKLNTVEIEEVDQLRKQEDSKVIDVRSPERYRGESEPIDLIAGHIPGAINIPYETNLDENGLFLEPEALKRKYLNALEKTKSKDAVFHCGSGVTACHSILAMAYAGLEIPKLYVGSWSEWSRNNMEMKP